MIRCFAVKNSLQILPQGGMQPCCKFRKAVTTIDNSSTSDYFALPVLSELQQSHDQGDWTSNCTRCKQDEDLGSRSRRQMYDNIGLTAGDFFLDISMSNHCNLACRMCSVEYSTKWTADSQALYDAGLSTKKDATVHTLTTQDIDDLTALLETKPGRVVVEVKGGEPLLMPISQYFFESLANCSNSATFEIWVTSNTTRIPNWWATVAAKFNKIRFHVSVDGTDETYQYIRGGHSYAGIKKNIKKLAADNTTILFNVVVQNLNIENLADLYDDLLTYVDVPKDINLLILRSPEHYQVNIYPDHAKQELIDHLQSRNLANHPTFNSIILLFDQPCDANKWNKFLKISTFLDNRRGQDICSVIKAINPE